MMSIDIHMKMYWIKKEVNAKWKLKQEKKALWWKFSSINHGLVNNVHISALIIFKVMLYILLHCWLKKGKNSILWVIVYKSCYLLQ